MDYYQIKETHLSIDFYLTKTCNRDCHYCTAWTREKRFLDIDLVFFRKVCEYLSPYKTRINLLGGEPAMCHNLPEAIDIIKEYENLYPSVLSNSLVRNRYPFILEDPNILYIEHLVLDFYEDEIKTLDGHKKHKFFEENNLNNYNLIIQTPGYFKYRNKYNLSRIDHKNTLLKEYNSRSPTYDVKEQAPELQRRICAKFPFVPVIDFELQKIRHCSKKVINGSRQFEITKENIDKMMNFELFEYEEYCKKCTEIIADRPNDMVLRIMEVM